MAKSAGLTLQECWEIDRLYAKAATILTEARIRHAACDPDLAVRRAQESLELFLKSLFRFLQLDYRASHDVSKELYTLSEALKNYAIEKRQIARLVLANSVLTLWRSPAFYGDETLNVGGIFDAHEAELAVSYAELAQIVAGIVRSRVFDEASRPLDT
jgi:HEPN domain-containing protein